MKLYNPEVFTITPERNLISGAIETGFAIRHRKSKKFYNVVSRDGWGDCYVRSVLGKTVHLSYVENFYQKLYPPVDPGNHIPEIEWV